MVYHNGYIKACWKNLRYQEGPRCNFIKSTKSDILDLSPSPTTPSSKHYPPSTSRASAMHDVARLGTINPTCTALIGT